MKVYERLKMDLSNQQYLSEEQYKQFLAENDLSPDDDYVKSEMQKSLLFTVIDVLEAVSNVEVNDGITYTPTIGTVTTLAAGTNATASASINGTNAEFIDGTPVWKYNGAIVSGNTIEMSTAVSGSSASNAVISINKQITSKLMNIVLTPIDLYIYGGSERYNRSVDVFI